MPFIKDSEIIVIIIAFEVAITTITAITASFNSLFLNHLLTSLDYFREEQFSYFIN